MSAIVSDEDVRSGQPRIDGTRITVLDLKRRVIENGEDPHVVAGEYDIELAYLFRALTYYYDNPEDFRAHERAVDADRSEGEMQTERLLSNLERDESEPTEQAE